MSDFLKNLYPFNVTGCKIVKMTFFEVLATHLSIHKPVKCYYFTKQINSSLKELKLNQEV
jgi:hypothetical protein